MTIKHLSDNNNINVYFHMKNHYKKLRNVKSVIDTSAPQGFVKLNATPPNSDRSWKTCSVEERHAKDYSHLPNHSSQIKRHNCITENAKSNASIRSASTPPRPQTRRHPYEMPFKSQWKSRSQSVGMTSRKDVSIDPCHNRVRKKRLIIRNKNNIPESENKMPEKEGIGHEDVLSDDTNRSVSSRKTASSKNEKIVSELRTEEHEYLQFLLRITEDIIINNFYTSEDVEKVFRNHVEANKDRLKMDKMEAQLDRLCKELHIPYKCTENGTKGGKCYPNFFENNKHVSRYTQHLANCECGKERVLQIDTEDKKTNTIIRYNGDITNIDSIEYCLELDNNSLYPTSSIYLLNKHSLGRVTECTEPTNSVETLASSRRYASITTVSSFENGVLPCFEFLDVGSWAEKNNSGNEGLTEAEIFANELPLTEKEKTESIEEKIMFNKLSLSGEKHTEKDNSKNENPTEIPNNHVDKALHIKNAENKVNENDTLNKNPFELSDVLIGDYNGTPHANKEYHHIIHPSPIPSYNTEHINLILTELNTNMRECKEIIPTAENKNLDDTLKFTFDQSTQIEVSQRDKECNTDQNHEFSINDDYVLINGPIYILKSVLNTKDNIILQDDSHAQTKTEKKTTPEKLHEYTTLSFNTLYATDYNSEPVYPRQSHFAKLLHSDYDLTPQRDDNTSEKYHHLFVDASTSVTNLTTTTIAVSTLKPDTLLLTENYSFGNKDKDSAKEVDGKELEEQRYDQNSYTFSTNELSSDGQYEIKSYTIPKKVNGCVQLSGYALAGQAEGDVQIRERTTELDLSLSAYEIESHGRDVGELGKAGARGDLVELGGGKVADEENSQASSVRSEQSQSSATSATYTKNILGKRKLNHPP